MENTNDIINTSVVATQYVKNTIHFFCKVVTHEGNGDLIQGLNILKDNIVSFSSGHTVAAGVQSVTYSDFLLEYFFNQQNRIPGYVYYWLTRYYECTYGRPSQYTERHYDVYHALQKMYIDRYRLSKQDDKDMILFRKYNRRRIGQLYKSGEYAATFSLYNKPLDSFINKSKLEDITLLLTELFHDVFDEIEGDYDLAAAYMIGRLQGASE